MLREIKWPVWLLLVSLFVTFFIIVGVGIHTINSNASHKEQLTVEIKSEQIDSGIELQSETKEADDFTSFVSFPFMSIENIDVPIKKWVSKQEDLFQGEINSYSDILNEEVKAHFNLQSNVTKISKHIISIDMSVEHFIAQETVYSYAKTFTVDRKNEAFIDITDVIPKKLLEGETLYLLLEDKLKEVDDSLVEAIHKIPYDQLIWSIKDDYMIFYFNPNELEKNDKLIKIHIPIIDLHEYLTETYKDILITEEIEEEITRLKKAATQIPRKLKKDGKYVALTFDDGPDNNVTPRILSTLKEYDAKATFFMLSRNVENNPDLALDVAFDGHEIANHSNTHVNLNAVKSNRIQEEIQDSLERIENAIGIKPVTFRPPYGEYNDAVVKYAAESEQYVINWSVDSLDWQSRNAKSVYNTVVKYTRPGSIVLFHDIHQPTADALPKIMRYLSDQDYEFVTVSELLPLLEDEGYGPYFGH